MGFGIEGNSFSSMQDQFQSKATGTMASINPGSTTKTESKPGAMDMASGMAGGAIAGFQMGGPWGAAAGAILGLASNFF